MIRRSFSIFRSNEITNSTGTICRKNSWIDKIEKERVQPSVLPLFAHPRDKTARPDALRNRVSRSIALLLSLSRQSIFPIPRKIDSSIFESRGSLLNSNDPEGGFAW